MKKILAMVLLCICCVLSGCGSNIEKELIGKTYAGPVGNGLITMSCTFYEGGNCEYVLEPLSTNGKKQGSYEIADEIIIIRLGTDSDGLRFKYSYNDDGKLSLVTESGDITLACKD